MGRASEVSRLLAEQAETVCRHYLSNGRRVGSFWIVGDVHNTKGRSLYIRLRGEQSRIGRWTDAATDEYGDLLDLIRLATDSASVGDAIAEAERFLGAVPASRTSGYTPSGDGPPASVRAARLLAHGRPPGGTLAERYLLARGLAPPWPSGLGYLPTAMYRDGCLLRQGPAILAPITTMSGRLIGVHRTWIAVRNGAGVALQRRILGYARGGAVFLGGEGPLVLAGEGIETVLSLRPALPLVRLYAALSAGKLGSWPISTDAEVLLVAVDRDEAGERAATRLGVQARARGLPFLPLMPAFGDFNDDLRALGADALRANVLRQIGEAIPAIARLAAMKRSASGS